MTCGTAETRGYEDGYQAGFDYRMNGGLIGPDGLNWLLGEDLPSNFDYAGRRKWGWAEGYRDADYALNLGRRRVKAGR